MLLATDRDLELACISGSRSFRKVFVFEHVGGFIRLFWGVGQMMFRTGPGTPASFMSMVCVASPTLWEASVVPILAVRTWKRQTGVQHVSNCQEWSETNRTPENEQKLLWLWKAKGVSSTFVVVSPITIPFDTVASMLFKSVVADNVWGIQIAT